MSEDSYAVRLREDGPAKWSNAVGWYVDENRRVLKGLSKEQAEGLVNSKSFFEYANASPEPDASTSDTDAETSDEPEAEAKAESESEADVEAPFAPSEKTVADLQTELDEGDYDSDALEALLEAEKAGKNRDTAVEAIRDAQE